MNKFKICVLCVLVYGLNQADLQAQNIGYSVSIDKIANPISNATLKPVSEGLVVQPNDSGVPSVIYLKSDQVYTQTIIIRHSNVTLDCQNAILDGNNEIDTAILVTGKLTSDNLRQIKNITIRNCQIKNFNQGIRVDNVLKPETLYRKNFPELIQNHKNQNWMSIVLTMTDRADIRQLARNNSPKNIKIINNLIENTEIGIYVGTYVNGVNIFNSTIRNSEIGAHLSYSSAGTGIFSSDFLLNGNRSTTNSNREAIVIDGSTYNKIEGNVFRNNYGSAIRLYKNCGESASNASNIKNKQGGTREESSKYNKIRNNSFYLTNSFYKKNVDQGFTAIEVASRQDRNSLGWMCSDGYHFVDYQKNHKLFSAVNARKDILDPNNKYSFTDLIEVDGYEKQDVRAYARDYASHNTIENNHFRNFNSKAILVKDDANEIINNLFDDYYEDLIIVGSKIRGKIQDPVIGNFVSNNCAGNDRSVLPSFIGLSERENNSVIIATCGFKKDVIPKITLDY